MLIIGLGNPGPEYETTYHNAGRLFVEKLAAHWGGTFECVSGKQFEYCKINGWKIIRTNVFMNESGIAVREAMDYFDIDAVETIVANDDSDLPLGTYKYVVGGGSAGHHGIDSVMQHLGSSAFGRLRIGIRPAEEIPAGNGDSTAIPRKKAGDFVLKPISPKDKETLYGVFNAIIENVIEKDTPRSSTTIS